MPIYYNCPTTGGQVVWQTWTYNSAANTTGTIIWNTWASMSGGNCTASMTNTVWNTWSGLNTSGTGGSVLYQDYQQYPSTPVKEHTAEEKARLAEEQRCLAEERARIAELFRKQEEERRKEAEAALKRAEGLLMEFLDPYQQEEYAKDKSFHVKGADGERYKVRHAWSGHVDRVNEKGKVVERFCIHPRESVPIPDNQLVAKLMLETNPAEFRKKANVTQVA